MSENQKAVDAPLAENPAAADDPYLWLEEINSAEVRAWVEARNGETMAVLGDAQFEADRTSVLDILNAADRIPWIQERTARACGGGLASYRGENPNWETMLDIDLLAKSEAEDWA